MFVLQARRARTDMYNTINQQVLDQVDVLIGVCNDDINHLDNILAEASSELLSETYERKITLVKFRAAFAAGIQVGRNAYSKEILVEMVEQIIDMQEATS